MKKLSLFFTGCAAVALCACSSDEPANGGGNNEVPDDVAYLSINIKDANALGRAVDTKYDETGFEFGDEKTEGKVATAKFLFYDAAGAFQAEANIWDPQGPGTPDPGNIEYMGKNVLVLKGLKGSSAYPKYMLTVLNAPASLEYGYDYTLEQTRKSLLSIKNGENFIMSTTSFYGGTASDGTTANEASKYYVNTLLPGDFLREPATSPLGDAQTVDVYVERLAAKVVLTVDDDLEATTLGDGSTGYAVDVTVGGNDNPETGEGTDVAATKLYVKLDSWGLNGTSKNSYLSKNLDEWSATDDIDGWLPMGASGWNWKDYHRSYWGASVNYGNDADLNFVKWGDLSVPMATAAYCAENTNDVAHVFTTAADGSSASNTVNLDNVTTVLVKATVCGKDGNAVDLVLYNGVYYLESSFVKYELATLKAANRLNFYFKTTGDDGTTFEQLDENDVKLVTSGQGTGYVKLAANFTDDVYAKTGTGNTEEDYELIANGVNEVNALFDAFANDSKAMAYKGGASYYTIPVEHLNSTKENADKAVEAKYGVVRNHYYKLNVTSLKRIGQGVFDPDNEVIKPIVDQDPTFYMGAQINILSWKIVNQDVELD